MENAPHADNYNIPVGKCAEFLNSIPTAIFRTTLEGKIVFCNQAFARIFGFDSTLDLMDYPVIELYQNKKDRGLLVNSIIQRGRLVDLPIAFKRKDGKPIWCVVTARAVLDDDGLVVNLDGTLRDISAEIDAKKVSLNLDGRINEFDDIIVLFDLQGNLLDINQSGTDLLGVSKEKLLGKPLSDLLVPSDRDLFLIFLADILKIGRNEVILSILDSRAQIHHLDCHAVLVKEGGRVHHIICRVRDVTQIVNWKKERSKDEKFQGVLEMAGGVAHSLSQPLTIINNLLNEIMSNLEPDGPIYQQIVKVHQQINKMNTITKKIANIKKYEAVDYVAGVKIVDIDKAS